MSRWKDTLCGKQIQSQVSTNDQLSIIPTGFSDILSCGGQFLPRDQASERSALHRIDNQLGCVFLPKDKYEIVLSDPLEGFLRFGGKVDAEEQECEVLEEEIDYLAEKFIK